VNIRKLTLAVPLLLLVPFLVGHDLFIKLDSYFLAPDSEARIPILNGTFEESENSITADRVVDIVLAGASETSYLDVDGWDASGDTTFMTLRTGQSGTYVFGVSTHSRLIELDAASFNEYLEHDGVDDILAARKSEGELERDAVERYSKHVKAVLQVGEIRSGGWDRALGFPAEIVPQANPYELRTGAEIQAILTDLGSSGLSQREFAASRDVPLSTLQSWLRKYRAVTIPDVPEVIPVGMFSGSLSGFEIEFPGGEILRLGSGFRGEDLQIVLQELRRC